MNTNELFGLALGLSGGWKVVGSVFVEDGGLSLELDFERGARFACPECVELCPVHDKVEKEWRHMDFWQHRTLLTARVPRVKCLEHGVRQVEAPWAVPGSGFTLMMESLIMLLCQRMPVAKVFQELAGQMNAHEADPSQIELVCMDMSKAFRKGATATFPKGARRLRPVAVAALRPAGCLRQAVSQGPAPRHADGGAGTRPRTQASAAQRSRPQRNDAGHPRQLPDTLLRTVGVSPQAPAAHPKLAHTMALFDAFQDILEREDASLLRWWHSWAQLIRFAPFVALARSARKQWDGITAFMETRVTSGRMEAIKGLIPLAKRLARGFRNFPNFRGMAYLKAGNPSLDLPSLKSYSF